MEKEHPKNHHQTNPDDNFNEPLEQTPVTLDRELSNKLYNHIKEHGYKPGSFFMMDSRGYLVMEERSNAIGHSYIVQDIAQSVPIELANLEAGLIEIHVHLGPIGEEIPKNQIDAIMKFYLDYLQPQDIMAMWDAAGEDCIVINKVNMTAQCRMPGMEQTDEERHVAVLPLIDHVVIRKRKKDTGDG